MMLFGNTPPIEATVLTFPDAASSLETVPVSVGVSGVDSLVSSSNKRIEGGPKLMSSLPADSPSN